MKKVVDTIGVDTKMKEDSNFQVFVMASTVRFDRNDWGRCCEEDCQVNDEDPKSAMGVYVHTDGTKIWIKSDPYPEQENEPAHEVITILFPSEY